MFVCKPAIILWDYDMFEKLEDCSFLDLVVIYWRLKISEKEGISELLININGQTFFQHKVIHNQNP